MSSKVRLSSPELEAVALAYRIAGKQLRTDLYARARQDILPEWQSKLSEKAGGNKLAQQVLVKTTRVNATTRGITLTSAKSKRKLAGGFIPAFNFAAIEFGATWRKADIKGRRGQTDYKYKRQINTAFRHRKRKGYIFYPTAEDFIFRLAALWVQTTVRTLRDAAEGK